MKDLGTVSCQAAKQLCAGCEIPAFSQGGHQPVLRPARCRWLRALPLLRSTHWEHVCKRVCFTQVGTLGVWGTGSSQQQGNSRGSFSWLLAGGKGDPGTETKAGLALFGDQQRGGRWGRGGRLCVCLREESVNKSLGLKIRSSVSPVGCEVEFANVICWDRKIQTVYLESLLQLLTLWTKILQI